MIARVQPLTRTRAVRGLFDYLIGPGQELCVGSLVRVPFGARSSLGVVVELAGRSELALERLAVPEAVLGPGIGPDLVELAFWMAREYCSTPARALQLMVAPGAAAGTGARLALVAELTPAGAAALDGNGVSLTDQQQGPLTDRPQRALSDRQQRLLSALRDRGPVLASELGTPALRRLQARGLATLTSRPRPRRPAGHAVGHAAATAPALTAEQAAALGELQRALRGPAAPPAHLLQGVTGSGKTEVYLGAVEAVLAAGRSAIVLVPEIALTPQTLWRFQARFGDVVAVLHSGLSAGERHDEWMRLRTGDARVCVGPRSAVFAPLEQIGLIVVDEEHEGSYKHEGDPRYDARTVARERARRHGALLVFGSATPRPESVLSTTRLRLRERVDRRPLPSVQVLDMRGRHQPLHPETRMALADLSRAGGKAILLVNRRGWSNFLTCRACGRVWLCPNCDVALVLHRSAALVACHHCGHRQRVPTRCDACASVSVARHGAGTEQIEHELRAALGHESFPIFRLDADSSTLAARARTLQRFEQASAGVLVGTQMVAKGHDFADVSLGVVLDADQTLRFPDFRAEERTFTLITQLAGRTGRGSAGGTGRGSAGGTACRGDSDPPGRVLVQTLAPDARAIAFAVRHDSDGFVADELERRRQLRYPPYASLIRIVCAAPQDALALETATAIRARLDPPDATVLGPAPLFRLRSQSRSQVVVKASARQAAIDAVGLAVDAIAPGAARRGASVSVDVDPQ